MSDVDQSPDSLPEKGEQGEHSATNEVAPGDVPVKSGQRQRIGILDTEPHNSRIRPEGLTPQQQALREATIKRFKSNKVKAFVAKQIKYINANRQVADGIRFLFDE